MFFQIRLKRPLIQKKYFYRSFLCYCDLFEKMFYQQLLRKQILIIESLTNTWVFRFTSINKTIHIHLYSDSSFIISHFIPIQLSLQYLFSITRYPQSHMARTLSFSSFIEAYSLLPSFIIFHLVSFSSFSHVVIFISLRCHYYLLYSSSTHRFSIIYESGTDMSLEMYHYHFFSTLSYCITIT